MRNPRYFREDLSGSMVVMLDGTDFNGPHYVEITKNEYDFHVDAQQTQPRKSALSSRHSPGLGPMAPPTPNPAFTEHPQWPLVALPA